MSDAAFDMPPVSAGFDARGAWLIRKLMADLSLLPEQAAGIVGTLHAESGLEAIQEIGKSAPNGGFGWEQATGSRRSDFYRWAADHNMSVTDDAANYGFMLDELRGTEAHALERLRQTTTVEAATETFVKQFERPADPDAETARAIPMAKRALAAAGRISVPAIHQPQPEPVIPQVIMPPQVQPAPYAMPPIANGAVAGGLTLVSMMLVQQAVFAFSLWQIAVPENLQNLTVGGLVVLIGWFLHTRLAKALKLDKGE